MRRYSTSLGGEIALIEDIVFRVATNEDQILRALFAIEFLMLF
jgi:hypothetical protein